MRRGAGTGGRRKQNHPLSASASASCWSSQGFTYYLSGDTDVLVDNVQCDVLFVVCDGIWNMPDYEKSVPAQVAAMDVLPGLVVPYHYGVDAPSTKENGGAVVRRAHSRRHSLPGMEKGAVLTLWRNAAFHPSCRVLCKEGALAWRKSCLRTGPVAPFAAHGAGLF